MTLTSGELPDPASLSRSQAVTLALQGGGSLGAFAWGVLDKLLDVPGLRIGVVSGASAGAMNAAMLAQGLATGGPAEAKRLLEAFWRRVAMSSGSPDVTGAADWLFPFSGIMADALRQTTKGLARQQINPLGLNPLRAVLDGLFDPSVLGRDGAPPLVVSATRVSSGEARLFQDAEITTEVLLASSCLPQLFPAVEIEGEFYWDGGFSSNPPLRSLIEAGAPSDVILVRTTPQERPVMPTSGAAILERTEELTFGAALRQELRSLASAQRLIADLPATSETLERLRDARLHVIGAEEEFRALKIGSHQDASWAFLQEMRELGHRAAEDWLATDFAGVGHRSTFNLSSLAQPLL
ncbi:patatin-like phospholipase family protein [Teichococcus wenyumeiae]|uniref:patatin-like phospholipase family protein n=1 Tax=Teichococcus wenyumeiae TaxID=2478470 RepID=UPI0013148B39|nr:patatin-like phospholipase family protein [Pseudoroseomonas wenyumeiae]